MVADATEMLGATTGATESSKAGARAANVTLESRVGRPVVPEEQATLPEMSEGVVGHVVRPLSPQVAPLDAEEEDEVEEIEREESRPQAIRILRKWGMKWWS
jgi:hypothetical protein